MDARLFEVFAAVEQTHWWFLARREIVVAVAERAVRPGGSVLDIGCGTGFVLERLRKRFDACGVDVSPLALQLCRERGLERVWAGSPEDLSAVAGRQFDGALFLDVIEHLDDDEGALRRAREVLAPGGAVLVTVPAFGF
nr:class I SAM-dependent methyltransferase [Gemmatimonadales bacterium]